MSNPILSAPSGFTDSCKSLDAMISSSPASALSALREASSHAHTSASSPALVAASYIIDSSSRAGIDTKSLRRLLDVHTDLSSGSIDCLIKVYDEYMTRVCVCAETTDSVHGRVRAHYLVVTIVLCIDVVYSLHLVPHAMFLCS